MLGEEGHHGTVGHERRYAVGFIRHELQRTDPQENNRHGNSEGSNADPLGNRSSDHTEYAKDICGHWKVSSGRCFKRLTPRQTRRECAWNTRAPRNSEAGYAPASPFQDSMPGAAYVCSSLVIVVSGTPAKLLANR